MTEHRTGVVVAGEDTHTVTLRELRERAGLTQAALGALLQVSAGAIGNWEAGRLPVSNDRLNGLAVALGVSVDQMRAVVSKLREPTEVRRRRMVRQLILNRTDLSGADLAATLRVLEQLSTVNFDDLGPSDFAGARAQVVCDHARFVARHLADK